MAEALGEGTPRAQVNLDLPRKLGLVDALAIVVGFIIGSGIFLVPNVVARVLPSQGLILAAWILAGMFSLLGALALAEFSAMMPATGGMYVFLRESFGTFWAFLFGWSMFLVIRSGGTAALAVGFSIYLSYFIHLPPILSKLPAVALIAILTYVNYRGVREGAVVQNTFTLLKILGLAILFGGVFWSNQPSSLDRSAGPVEFSMTQFGVALVACMWAYNGWFAVSLVAGEIKRPERNLPLSLGLGMAIVIAVYLVANLAYMHALPVDEIAKSERVAAVAAERTMGSIGATLVSVTILVSIIGATNAGILAAPRVYFAQARDGLFFARFGEVHPRFQTPSFSILIQGLWSSVLVLSGTYEALFSYVIFMAWLFYGLTVVGVFVLRRKSPDRPRPYKMWGYPLTPVLFVLFAFSFVVNTIVTKPGPSIMGLVIVASGIPAYYFWERRKRGSSVVS
ncbi:amino acid permease [Acidobacteria bacterium AH-259-L09]|nr:amino acid permease [Acidobacteria bacterium AH-259-L09]